MILYAVLFGLATILILAWFKPKMFERVRESIAGAWFVSGTGVITGLYELLSTDTNWHELVDPAQLPLFLFGLGVFGILLRNINVNGR